MLPRECQQSVSIQSTNQLATTIDGAVALQRRGQYCHRPGIKWHCSRSLLTCVRLVCLQSKGDFEALRSYLRQLAVAAYYQKKEAVDDIEVRVWPQQHSTV